MAGVMTPAETRGQFAAIAELRWHLFRNSLRTRRGRAELVSRIIIGAFFGLFGIGGSVGFGVGAWYFLSKNKAAWFALLLWPIFLFWELFPVVATAFTENMESASLLRFPLGYRAYFMIRVAYGLFDPSTTVGCIWLLGILFGTAVARPALLPIVAIILLVFAAVNILLTRVVFAWVERWLAQRRTRELLGILVFLALISLQLIGPLMERYSQRPRPGVESALERISFFQQVLPPGLAGASISSASQGQFAMATLWLIGVCSYGVVFIGLLHFRLRAQFQGENLSEAGVSKLPKAQSHGLRLGWKLPAFSDAVSAVFEKEVRILARSGPMLLTLVMPIVALFVLRVGHWSSGSRGVPSTMMHASDFGFPIGAIYALLMLTNLVYNNFGADGFGMQFFVVSPTRFREIVLGKNLVHAACLAGEVILVWLAVNFVYGRPSSAMTAATLAALLFAAPLNFAAGNLFSLYSPKKVDYGVFGRQKASQTTVLASFGIQLCILGIGAGTVFFARAYGNMWIAAPIFLLLSVFSFAAYSFTLSQVDKIALDRRETLVLELGKA